MFVRCSDTLVPPLFELCVFVKYVVPVRLIPDRGVDGRSKLGPPPQAEVARTSPSEICRWSKSSVPWRNGANRLRSMIKAFGDDTCEDDIIRANQRNDTLSLLTRVSLIFEWAASISSSRKVRLSRPYLMLYVRLFLPSGMFFPL